MKLKPNYNPFKKAFFNKLAALSYEIPFTINGQTCCFSIVKIALPCLAVTFLFKTSKIGDTVITDLASSLKAFK